MDVLTQTLFRAMNHLIPNGRFNLKSFIFLCEIETITGLTLSLLYLSLLLNYTVSNANDIQN
jgi:hypothetical protein